MLRTARDAAAILAACLLVLILSWHSGRAQGLPEVDVALVFAVDVSGSMNADEIEIARQAHATALASPDVLGAIGDGALGRIAVAYVEFGDTAAVGVEWMVIGADGQGAADFARHIADLPAGNYLGTTWTAVGAGLLAADDLLSRAPAAPRLVVDIIGDGVGTGSPSPDVGREAILSRGAVINAMPLMVDRPDVHLVNFYTKRVASGPGHFVMPIAGIDKMPMALRSKIVLELY